jgi:hypothetical protein
VLAFSFRSLEFALWQSSPLSLLKKRSFPARKGQVFAPFAVAALTKTPMKWLGLWSQEAVY